MKKGEKEYRKLKKQGLSDKEIAEAFILPSKLSKKEMNESNYLMNFFRSDEFKKSYRKSVEKATWGEGKPMVYMRDNGDIVKHFKSGAFRIIKKAKKK